MTKKKSHKTNNRKMNIYLKSFLIALSCILCLVIIIALVAPISEAYMYLYPKKNTNLSTWPDEEQLGLYYESYRIKISDSSEVGAWLIPAQDADTGDNNEFKLIDSDKLIIFSHNYQSNRCGEDVNAMWIAKQLCLHGYNVLTFDYSGSGKSNGKGYFLGQREATELSSVIEYCSSTLGYSKISLIGWGYGAASALVAGSSDSKIDGIISDTSYTDLDSYLSEYGNRWSSLPSWTNQIFKDLCKLISGNKKLFENSPIKSVSEAKDKCFLFIHGRNDDLFPLSGSEKLSSSVNSSCTSDLWVIDGASHLGSYETQPENYFTKILEFLSSVYKQ